MVTAAVIEALRGVPLFAELSDEQLLWLAENGEVVELESGGTILAQGEPVKHFWVLLEGETRFTIKNDGRESPFISHTPGVFFAEVPILLGTPSLATGRALMRSRFFRLPADGFWTMLRTMPATTARIVTAAAERLNLRTGILEHQERLAALGRLSAGLAHELNNPASAARRTAGRLIQTLRELRTHAPALGDLAPRQRNALLAALDDATGSGIQSFGEDALERGDREDELADRLDDLGVAGAWDLAPTLVEAGLDADGLDGVVGDHDEAAAGALAWLASTLAAEGLAREIGNATAQLSELVEAMKEYTRMDQAPEQETDIHDGIESTLTILGHKLREGHVSVERDYDRSLPCIFAHGPELNQVWTNLIDNALDAMSGREGRIRISTRREGEVVLVEVSDDGPGIPKVARDRVFEPFFTTKGVGEGTGQGLDVSRRIVVERHGGDIRVESEPGDTRFQVRLPITAGEEKTGGNDVRST